MNRTWTDTIISLAVLLGDQVPALSVLSRTNPRIKFSELNSLRAAAEVSYLEWKSISFTNNTSQVNDGLHTRYSSFNVNVYHIIPAEKIISVYIAALLLIVE